MSGRRKDKGLNGSANARSPDGKERTTPDDLSATTIGRYIVLQEIGRGAMGKVLKAFDPHSSRSVAIKLVHLSLDNADLTTTHARQRALMAEAQSMARLAHDHIVSVYDAGYVDNQFYIVMEFVAGTTLDVWLKKQQPKLAQRLTVAEQLLAAVAAVHRAGLIHRDIKPQNILIHPKRGVLLTDFGIAFLDESNARANPGFVWGGTPYYMAPEQHEDQPVDARADQYAAALVIVELLLGHLLFSEKSQVGLQEAKLRLDTTRPPAAWHAGRRRWQLLARSLAPNRADRYESIQQLEQQLHRCRTERPILPWLMACALAIPIAVASSVKAPEEHLTRACQVLYDSSAPQIARLDEHRFYRELKLAHPEFPIQEATLLAQTVGQARSQWEDTFDALCPSHAVNSHMLDISEAQSACLHGIAIMIEANADNILDRNRTLSSLDLLRRELPDSSFCIESAPKGLAQKSVVSDARITRTTVEHLSKLNEIETREGPRAAVEFAWSRQLWRDRTVPILMRAQVLSLIGASYGMLENDRLAALFQERAALQYLGSNQTLPAVSAWAYASFSLLQSGKAPEEAYALLKLARASAARGTHDAILLADLAYAQGRYLASVNKYSESGRSFLEQATYLTEAGSTGLTRTGVAYSNAAFAWFLAKEYEQAYWAIRQALASEDRAQEELSPGLLQILRNGIVIAQAVDRPQEALEWGELALKVAIANPGVGIDFRTSFHLTQISRYLDAANVEKASQMLSDVRNFVDGSNGISILVLVGLYTYESLVDETRNDFAACLSRNQSWEAFNSHPESLGSSARASILRQLQSGSYCALRLGNANHAKRLAKAGTEILAELGEQELANAAVLSTFFSAILLELAGQRDLAASLCTDARGKQLGKWSVDQDFVQHLIYLDDYLQSNNPQTRIATYRQEIDYLSHYYHPNLPELLSRKLRLALAKLELAPNDLEACTEASNLLRQSGLVDDLGATQVAKLRRAVSSCDSETTDPSKSAALQAK